MAITTERTTSQGEYENGPALLGTFTALEIRTAFRQASVGKRPTDPAPKYGFKKAVAFLSGENTAPSFWTGEIVKIDQAKRHFEVDRSIEQYYRIKLKLDNGETLTIALSQKVGGLKNERPSYTPSVGDYIGVTKDEDDGEAQIHPSTYNLTGWAKTIPVLSNITLIAPRKMQDNDGVNVYQGSAAYTFATNSTGDNLGPITPTQCTQLKNVLDRRLG